MINGCGGRRGRDLILLTIVMILVNVRRLNPNPEGINWKLVWKLNVQQRFEISYGVSFLHACQLSLGGCARAVSTLP